MSRSWRLYLNDIRECCLKVARYTDGMSEDQFVEDETSRKGLSVTSQDDADGRAPLVLGLNPEVVQGVFSDGVLTDLLAIVDFGPGYSGGVYVG